MDFDCCPRCESLSYERLSTHACCHVCFYSPDLEEKVRDPRGSTSIPGWAWEAYRKHERALLEAHKRVA